MTTEETCWWINDYDQYDDSNSFYISFINQMDYSQTLRETVQTITNPICEIKSSPKDLIHE